MTIASNSGKKEASSPPLLLFSVSWRGEDPLRGLLAFADAVGDADAVVGVAGEGEGGDLRGESFDAGDAVEVSDVVLGHRLLPAEDAGEEGRGGETLAQNLAQFAADGG